jgi:hypothetical protein
LNKQVGSELGISEFTVKAHRGQAMRKMQADSLPDLVTMAARHDLRSAPNAWSATTARLPCPEIPGVDVWVRPFNEPLVIGPEAGHVRPCPRRIDTPSRSTTRGLRRMLAAVACLGDPRAGVHRHRHDQNDA